MEHHGTSSFFIILGGHLGIQDRFHSIALGWMDACFAGRGWVVSELFEVI